MPIVPSSVLNVQNLNVTASEEPMLLTAILTVSTKDKPRSEALHTRLWKHMKSLILKVALGEKSVRRVASVESLLLLAEWVHGPKGHRMSRSLFENSDPASFDTEEHAAWSLVGLAVRQSYLLYLDKYSFREEDSSKSAF